MKFDDVVRRVRTKIQAGRVIHSRRVREGRMRHVSVGPYRTAVGGRTYALIVQPALPSWGDDIAVGTADRAARAFVRLVGTDAADDALRAA